METVIKLKLSELTDTFLQKLKDLVNQDANTEVTVTLKTPTKKRAISGAEYLADLEESIRQTESGETVAFTWDEFKTLTETGKR